MSDETDPATWRANWTIKNFRDDTRQDVVAAAHAEGMSVHAWLERVCRDALGRPLPDVLAPGQPANNRPDMDWVAAPVAAAVQARDAGFPGLASELAAMVRRQVRAWQGLPPLKRDIRLVGHRPTTLAAAE